MLDKEVQIPKEIKPRISPQRTLHTLVTSFSNDTSKSRPHFNQPTKNRPFSPLHPKLQPHQPISPHRTMSEPPENIHRRQSLTDRNTLLAASESGDGIFFVSEHPRLLAYSQERGVALFACAEQRNQPPVSVSLVSWTMMGLLWSLARRPFGTRVGYAGVVYQFRTCKCLAAWSLRICFRGV